MAILLRTLTLKTKIGFGEYKMFTVQEVMDKFPKGKQFIAKVYYECAQISFSQDIIALLKIIPIEKPGKQPKMLHKWRDIFFSEIGYSKSDYSMLKFEKQENKARVKRGVGYFHTKSALKERGQRYGKK